MKADLSRLAEALRSVNSITLISHVSPDGDTVGAVLALSMALRQMGKRTVCYCSDRIPHRLAFLPGGEAFTQNLAEASETEAVFCVDIAAPDRTGAGEVLLKQGKPVLVLDHHVSNKGYGDLCYVSGCGSASEPVCALLDELGIAPDRDMADALYTGMVTDTGRFSFPGVTGNTLRMAARCLDAGAAYSDICRTQFQLRTLSATRLLGVAISSLELAEDGRVAIMSVTPQDMAACNGVMEEMEGIVNYAVDIMGVAIGALLYPSNGRWKVSLRAAEKASVANLAVKLGGGGHAKAAGGHITGTLEAAKAALLEAIRETNALG